LLSIVNKMMYKRSEPIAVVGSACRFPGGSTSPSSLWELLQNPRDVSKEIPRDRFDVRGYYHPDGAHHATTPVRHSYLLEEDFRTFDSTFFNISPNEADSIDPQQRLLMETVYEALEAGGHPIEGLRGSNTAVFVGVMGVDYENLLMRDFNQVPTYFATGTSRAVLSNRISYFFDWRGPSMTIDTACSSSMIAVHQGVQSLRAGESRLAVACGATLILGPGSCFFITPS
jgi:hybrid polyketide synthase/nonribosomal peptide synthetase ACE1